MQWKRIERFKIESKVRNPYVRHQFVRDLLVWNRIQAKKSMIFIFCRNSFHFSKGKGPLFRKWIISKWKGPLFQKWIISKWKGPLFQKWIISKWKGTLLSVDPWFECDYAVSASRMTLDEPLHAKWAKSS